LAAILGYVIGSFPTAVLLARARGIPDPRAIGTGNPGASNMFLQAGVLTGLAVFVVDVAKGVLAVSIGLAIGGEAAAAAAGVAAVAGHIYPLFAGFRGGKGAATMFGAYIAIAPALAIAGLALWAFLSVAILRRFILATVATTALLAVAASLDGTSELASFAIGAALLMAWSHRSDLRAWRRMPTVSQALRDNRSQR
jgi:glycerol-3-phosphate acyltransferase PlsY